MNIPQSLTDIAQWILWKSVEREGKKTKVPCDASGRPVPVNDPASWHTYEQACVLYAENSAMLAGVGFCFTGDDDFFGVDLDDCLPNLTGDALTILARFATYAEVSPSGTGIKLIGRGTKGDFPRARTTGVIGFGQIEVYDRDRFFTITGNHFGVDTDVEDCQEALDWLLATFLTEGELQVSTRASLPIAPTPLLQRASGFNGTDKEALEAMLHFDRSGRLGRLWAGDLSDYDDDASRADAGLVEGIAWIVGPDAERIEAIFGHSVLAQREKWARDDYRERTISMVTNRMTDWYSGGPIGADTPSAQTDGVMPVNLIDLRAVESQKVNWWVQDFIPKGMAVMLASAGGVVKGLYTMFIAANHIAGPVLYLGAEDNLAMIVKPRAEAAGVDMERFIPLREVNLEDGTAVPIRFPCHASELEWAITKTGAQMVVIDAGPEHMQADLKSNAVEDVRRFMNPLNEIAERLNVTIFLILHTNKTQGASSTDRVAGNRAWVDSQRHVLLAAIDDEDEDVRHVQVGKTNISKQGIGRQFRIHTNCVKVRDRDTGLWVESDQPYIEDEGPSLKNVDDLIKAAASSKAHDDKLDRAILEYVKDGRKDSNDVDAYISETTGMSARTIRNHRMSLGKRGLLQAIPAEEENGRVKKWQCEITGLGWDFLDNIDPEDYVNGE